MIKQAVIIGCLAAAGAAEARQQEVAQVAPSQYADSESTTNMPWNLNLPSLKKYSVEVALVGTPSNNLEFAVGHDADRDGRLSLDERAWWLAWDCGEWIAGGLGGTFVPVTDGPDTNGVVRAHVEVAVSRHKAKPAWMYGETWDLVEVTRRGVDDPQERVSVGTETSGLMILVW